MSDITSIIAIPKIIHQIWIGHLPPPHTLLETWKNNNPDYKYILWNEDRIAKELPNQICQNQIKIIPEINGKADILRWEILYEFGGFFFDADSVCLKPLLDNFCEMPGNGFSCIENEIVREGLIACGSMGFIPKHPLVKRILESIINPNNQELLTTTRAWYSVGPGVITRVFNEAPVEERITVLSSHMFLPRHHTGISYSGHEQIYAYQFWGTNDRSYDSIDKMVVPSEFIKDPEQWVSVFVSSFNTPTDFVIECLKSIQRQTGYFGIELVWVNDGSNIENTNSLKYYLNLFKETSRFIRLKYFENTENLGCRRSLRFAVEHCSYDLIFKMDSDDIMMPQRLALQMQFMDDNPNTPLCGGQMSFFKDDSIIKTTRHPLEITWENFIQNRDNLTWFMNHPTLCFRKQALLSIGNYPDTPLSKEHPEKNMMDDYEIELKLLKNFGRICNLSETLLKYRVHDGQMTQQFTDSDSRMIAWRQEIIQQVFRDDISQCTVYKTTLPTPSTISYPFLTDKITIKSQPEVLINNPSIKEDELSRGEKYYPSHFVYI